MNQIRLAYSTFGLTALDFLDALGEVDRAGYDGVEISFHRDQFNPFNIDDDDLERVRKRLAGLRVTPACVATAAHFFNPQQPHEPSLMAVERAARKRRIDLVRRGIHVARKLHIPLVTFGSGFIRAEHLANPGVDPGDLLVDSIRECLRDIHDDEDITLLIEPEPGMFIETIDEGLALMQQVDSPKFRLHIDLCHAYCSEADYVAALAAVAPHTRYLHISDARPGYNLKIVNATPGLKADLARASVLAHFADTADYLLIDRAYPSYFCDTPPTPGRRAAIEALLTAAGLPPRFETIAYASLYAGASALDDEIFTWMISIPGLSYDVLERARPIVGWLRGARGPARVERLVANTLTGVAHFHEIPGEGSLDFAASFNALAEGGFSGFGAVELYHHVEAWERALADSYRHLSQFAGGR